MRKGARSSCTMMKKTKKWINVQNKYTYLFLLTIPVAILKIVLFDFDAERIDFYGIFVSLMILNIGIYLFIRFNTYSHFYNPQHPKPTK